MDNAPMYGLKMHAKYWDLVSMYRGSLGPLKGWGALANYLLANCDHFTACNCETISLLPNTRIFRYSDKETQPHSLNVNS
jgi:hypothetical protein